MMNKLIMFILVVAMILGSALCHAQEFFLTSIETGNQFGPYKVGGKFLDANRNQYSIISKSDNAVTPSSAEIEKVFYLKLDSTGKVYGSYKIGGKMRLGETLFTITPKVSTDVVPAKKSGTSVTSTTNKFSTFLGGLTRPFHSPTNIEFKIINDCQYVEQKDENTGVTRYKHYKNCNNPKHKTN